MEKVKIAVGEEHWFASDEKQMNEMPAILPKSNEAKPLTKRRKVMQAK